MTAPYPHVIEEAVRVYLRLSEDHTRWEVDRATVDGSPLFSDYDSPLHEECECPPELQHEGDELAERVGVYPTTVELPDAQELMLLLAAALGYTVTPTQRDESR